jgi:SLIT-ROBO Rho GTPase activating protein
MVTIEDYDVSECFHHSRSTESVKSAVSETYLSKPSIAKRRANQQETEQFYFMVGGGLTRGARRSRELSRGADI